MKNVAFALIALTALYAHSGAANASYPEQPIRIIVPFAPGGIADTTARVIGEDIAQQLGQPVIVDNRPGGATIIGTGVVAHAKPDGYTLLMGSTNVSTNAALYNKLPYDTDRDLAPVALSMTLPGAIVVNPALPITNYAELLAYARAHPGKLNYASVGQGSFPHLALEKLMQATAVKMTHVPYKGYAPAIMAVLSGEADLLASDLPGAMAYLKSGKLRAIALTGAKRAAVLPDVATIQESGAPQYEAVGWLGIMAPAGTPAAVIGTLNEAINKAMRKPGIAARFTVQGAEVVTESPADFRKFLDKNRKGWEQVIKAANISLESP